MRKIKYFVLAAICIVFALANIFATSDNYYNQISLLYLLAPLAAVVCSLVVGFRYGWTTKHGFSFGLVAASFTCWFIAETIFVYYDVFTNTPPFPSIADFFFILAGPFFVAGIVSEMFVARAHLSLKQAIGSAVIIVLIAAYLFGVVFEAEAEMLLNIVSGGYLLIDVLMVVAALYGLKISREYGGQMRTPWVLIAMGASLYLLGDFLYLFFLEQYEALVFWAVQIDILWVVSYILFAVAMARIKDTLFDAESRLIQKIGSAD